MPVPRCHDAALLLFSPSRRHLPLMPCYYAAVAARYYATLPPLKCRYTIVVVYRVIRHYSQEFSSSYTLRPRHCYDATMPRYTLRLMPLALRWLRYVI